MRPSSDVGKKIEGIVQRYLARCVAFHYLVEKKLQTINQSDRMNHRATTLFPLYTRS